MGSGVYPRVQGEVNRPSQRVGRGRKALLEVREGLGGPPRGPAKVGRPFPRDGRVQEGWQVSGVVRKLCRGPGGVGKPFRKAGRGREKSGFPKEGQDNWQALQDGREESRVPSAGPGGVRRPSRNAGKGCKALPLGQEGSEALPEGREGSGSTPERPGGIGRASRCSVRGQESFIGRP